MSLRGQVRSERSFFREKKPQRTVMHFCLKTGKSAMEGVNIIINTYDENRVKQKACQWFKDGGHMQSGETS